MNVAGPALNRRPAGSQVFGWEAVSGAEQVLEVVRLLLLYRPSHVPGLEDPEAVDGLLDPESSSPQVEEPLKAISRVRVAGRGVLEQPVENLRGEVGV